MAYRVPRSDVEVQRALVLREAAEIWNSNDLDSVQGLYAVQFSGRFGSIPLRGRSDFKEVVTVLLAAVPDIRVYVQDVRAEGSGVRSVWRATGTLKGELSGTLPTGERITMQCSTSWRFLGERILSADTDVEGLPGFELRSGRTDRRRRK